MREWGKEGGWTEGQGKPQECSQAMTWREIANQPAAGQTRGARRGNSTKPWVTHFLPFSEDKRLSLKSGDRHLLYERL
jgi:hypothetical protein